MFTKPDLSNAAAEEQKENINTWNVSMQTSAKILTTSY